MDFFDKSRFSHCEKIKLGNGLTLIDTATVFIPNAPKSTGVPSPGWWLSEDVDASKLPTRIYRVVIAESSTKHTFVRELPNSGVVLEEQLNDLPQIAIDRTWAEAQQADSKELSDMKQQYQGVL